MNSPSSQVTPPTAQSTLADPVLRGRRLFLIGVAGAAVVLTYYSVAADVSDPFHLVQGMTILALAVLPSLLWARRGGLQLPAFEVLLLTTANAYALPLLNGHTQLQHYDNEHITETANVVIIYQVAAIAAYALMRGRPGKTAFFRNEVLTRDLHRFVAYGLLISTGYVLVSSFFADYIPRELGSPLRAICYGIGMVATFSMARRWGLRELGAGERAFLVVMITLQATIQFSTLYLVSGMSIVLLGLVGYVSGARRLPIIATLALFTTAAVLHNGKSAMRTKYWNEEDRPEVHLHHLPAFFSEWVQLGLTTADESGDEQMAKKLLDRASLFHILCLVTSTSPAQQPFLEGATYLHIPGQFIPRLFWPDKPQAHISTSTLAIYYGLQTDETVRNATIGFGMVAEAYANFGAIGVFLFGALLGALYKRVQTATAHSPMLSYPGLFLIILTAWSLQGESTLAIWLSSMSQACIGVLGVPFVIRRAFG